MENQYIFNLHFRFDGESENVTSLLPPPIRIVLNEGTIYDYVSAVTKAYKTSKYWSYTKLSKSLLWGFSPDSISSGWSFLANSFK